MSAAEALQRKIRDAIPLSDAMQFSIDSLELNAIEVSAPLPPNVNIHGTGFAGSIYSVAVLTGWALCTHILDEMKVDAELVVAKAEIRYRAPVTGELRCTSGADEVQRASFLRDIEQRGKGVLPLEIKVGERPAAVLQATFCAIARSRADL
jgi:thioesterase domain-containing protein